MNARRSSLSHGIGDMDVDGGMAIIVNARPTSFVVPVPVPAPSTALESSHMSSMALLRSISPLSQDDEQAHSDAEQSDDDDGIRHAPPSLLQMLQRPAPKNNPPIHKKTSITTAPTAAPGFEENHTGEAPSLTTFSASLPMLLAAANTSQQCPNSQQQQQQQKSAPSNERADPSASNAAAISTKSDRFKPFHEEKWSQRLDELRAFRLQHGHCLVPHMYPENLKLACWVKRQRRQYKLMREGRTSTMSPERVALLEEAGFVWDSHDAGWSERFLELKEYRARNGNCLVPSTYRKNPQLAVWVKCQRRQHKLWKDGKPSSMTEERRSQLEGIGFRWEARPAAMHPSTV